MHEDRRELKRRADLVVQILRDRGFTARVETLNAAEAYLSTLPGDGFHNVRPMLSTRNVADIVPLTSQGQGLRFNPSALMPPQSPPLFYADTVSGAPYHFHLHVGQVGHGLVIGDTGGGKSILLQVMAAQWLRYRQAQGFIFDKGSGRTSIGPRLRSLTWRRGWIGWSSHRIPATRTNWAGSRWPFQSWWSGVRSGCPGPRWRRGVSDAGMCSLSRSAHSPIISSPGVTWSPRPASADWRSGRTRVHAAPALCLRASRNENPHASPAETSSKAGTPGISHSGSVCPAGPCCDGTNGWGSRRRDSSSRICVSCWRRSS